MTKEHKPYAKKFYDSKAWRECRQAYIESLPVPFMCEVCLDRYGEYNAGKILDHIIEINMDNINDPDITLNWDNLQFLCQLHHNQKTHGENGITDAIPEGTMFNENGQLIKKQ